MAGGGSGFGAFAGGLWQGASSALQLANTYKQYMSNVAAEEQMKQLLGGDNANAPDNNPPPAGASTTQAGTTTQAIPTDQGDQATPNAASPDMRERNQSTGTTTEGPVSPKVTKAAPTPTVTPKTRSEEVWYQLGLSDAAIRQRQEVATGAQTPLGTGAAGVAPPAGLGATERQAYGHGAGALPVYGAGAPAPGLGQRLGQMGTAIGGAASDAYRYLSGIGENTPEQAPYGGTAYGPPAPSSPTAPVGGYLGTGAVGTAGEAIGVPSSTAQPAPSPYAEPVRRTPIIPPPQNPAVMPPGAGRGVPRPTPLSEAQPPQNATQRILAAANPEQVQSDVSAIQGGMQQAQASRGGVPTAQVAGPGAPIPPPGTQIGAAATQEPVATRAVNGAVGGNAPIVPPHAPVTTPNPTTKEATALPPTPAPVPATAKVTPSQTGPSQQSEQTPPSGPPVSHAAFDALPKADQDYLVKVAREDGQGKVTPYQLAWTWKREGGGLRSGVSSTGSASNPARGPFQIQLATQHGVGMDDVDVSTFEGGARVAARYYAHIADLGYPVGSPAQSAAYMAGEGGASSYGKLNDLQRKNLVQMHPTFDASKDAWSDYGRKHSDEQVASTVVTNGNQDGPDGTLRSIINTQPAGIPLGQKWQNAEAAVIRAMIWHGQYSAIPQVHEWFAQQAHQGVLSNLYAGYQALKGGSPETAVQYFAKAHAFFPDGTFGRFGVDGKGNAVGQLYDENTHQPIGKGFIITPDAVEGQMMQILYPNKFLEKFQEMRAKNAEIVLHQAEAGYYLQRPRLQEESIQQRREAVQEQQATRRAGQEAAAERHEDTVDQQVQQERQHVDDRVDRAYAKDPGTGEEKVARYDKQTDEQYAHQQEAERYLQYSRRAGGAGKGQGAARSLAQQFSQGKLKLKAGTDENGRPAYGLYSSDDKENKNNLGTVSKELGDQLLSLPGMGRRAGAAALPENARPQAAIGAGLGTYAGLQAGGTTYGGIQTIPLPQTQSQQSMVA